MSNMGIFGTAETGLLMGQTPFLLSN